MHDLILNIRSVQNRAKLWWSTYATTVYQQPEGQCDIVIVNEFHVPTVIPSYKTYSDTWRRALLPNPLEFDWRDFKHKDPSHVAFLSSVVNATNEQVMLYNTDAETRNCLVLLTYAQFTAHLNDLLALCVSGGE